MKNKKRFRWLPTIALGVSLIVLLSSVCQKKFAQASTETTIAIMTTANLQSCIAPYTIDDDGKQLIVGGLERIASAAGKVRSEVDGSLLLSPGDDLMPPLFSVFHGEPEMRAMSLAGYDIVAPGNHEFDLGADAYRDALKFATFPIVSANLIIDDQELRNRILPYIIKNMGEIKIGVFGMMTPDFLKITNPGDGTTVNQDIASAAQKAVDSLLKEECDLIIALTHIGIKLDRQLAEKVAGIDIIIGGHDHQYSYETYGDTIIVQNGAKGEYLDVLRFTFTGGEIVNPTWEKILLDSTVGYDSEIRRLIAPYMAEYNSRLSQVIGESSVNLDAHKNAVRRYESSLGNFIADSWLARFNHADIALVNGGTIRGDKIYSAGPITYLTVNEILPFRDEIMNIKITGADLKQLLEISASTLRVQDDGCPDNNRAPSGGFFQMAGLRITIDLGEPPFCAVYSERGISQLTNPGSRIIKADVYLNGLWTPLDPSATYTVLVNKWTASGGDGYYILLREDIPKENTNIFSTDILATYVQLYTPISPQTEGRIDFVNK